MSKLIEYVNGNKLWFQENHQLHRKDGPAVEYANGDKLWYQNGISHREDGPAVEYADGRKFWFINDKQLTEQEFNRIIANRRIKLIR